MFKTCPTVFLFLGVFHLEIGTVYAIITLAGEIPKRLKGSVSKTDRGCKSCKGSNPFFSASRKINPGDRVFFFLRSAPMSFGKVDQKHTLYEILFSSWDIFA